LWVWLALPICQGAAASSVIGIDISEKMIQRAREMTNDPFITYIKKPIEDIDFSKSQFDVVISSLAFHF